MRLPWALYTYHWKFAAICGLIGYYYEWLSGFGYLISDLFMAFIHRLLQAITPLVCHFFCRRRVRVAYCLRAAMSV
jgi:hypothetical protein